MKLEWIAAVLRPEDIAPHPNLPDPKYDRTPPAQLAAAVLGDPRRGSTLNEFFSRDNVRESSSPEKDAIKSVLRTFSSRQIHEGISELTVFISDRATDLAAAASATLLAACALSEVEEHRTAIRLIEQMSQRITKDGNTPSHRFLQLTLSLQSCLRRRDWAEDYNVALNECRSILDELQGGAGLRDFPVGAGATGTSADTIRHILVAFEYSIWGLDTGDAISRLGSLKKLVAHERSEELLLLQEDAAGQYSRSIDDQFKNLFNDRSMVIGRSSAEFFYINLRHELLASASSFTSRRNLALFRLVQARTRQQPADYADCLRLLRYSSNADDHLDLTLRAIRFGGPLAALSHEARQVILRRLTPEHVRYAELAVVEASAELLTAAEAETALERLFVLIEAGCPFNVVGRWTAYSRRLQDTWSAASAVATSAGKTTELADRLLDDIANSKSSDETVDYAYARVIRTLSWDEVFSEVRERWISWINANLGRYPEAMDAARIALGLPVSHWSPEQELSLVTVGDVLNDAIRGNPLPDHFLMRAATTVSNSMNQLEEASNRGGPFGMGGVEPAACAALLISYGAHDLWTPLVRFLCNVRIPRSYRSAGFDRIIEMSLHVPMEVAEHFKSASHAILYSPDTLPMAGEDLVPYPSALRFLGAYQLIDEGSIISGLMRLVSSTDVKARIEAARSISVIARHTSDSWLLTVALQLSHDSSSETIRGHCSNALALLIRNDSDLFEAAATRLVELLNADGIIAPLLAIQGLVRNSAHLDERIASEVRRLAEQHPSRAVREQAKRFAAAG